ncbi:MAG TPA: Ig-like domain-containing protein [Pyrinomonadaceae bacterium]|nr:Ig-like domain-containing protein [Pyrinomonadaceae bacterium]
MPVVLWAVFGFAPLSVLQISGSRTSAAGVAQPQQIQTRTLSFEERVRYQRAVEEVYWRHTIWPQQNAGAKPALDEVASLDATRALVEDSLRKSDALARQWKRPVTGEQLQTELARMARETRQPGVLRELWQALDNDPFIIAEVLARPAIVERLARTYYASDERFHGALRTKVEGQLREHPTLDALRRGGSGRFTQIEAVKVERKSERVVGIADAATKAAAQDAALELSAAEWEAETARLREMFGGEGCETCDAAAGEDPLPLGVVSRLQEDEDSFYVTSVIRSAGKRLRVARIEWPKTSFESWWSAERAQFAADASTEGFDYQLAQINQTPDDTWTPTKALPVSTGTAVWTGTEMIIWGGQGPSGGRTNSGARYNPAVDTWTPTSAINAPQPRRAHSAVWTGTEMIVWGGCGASFDFCGLSDGGRYNPATDSWTPTSTKSAPSSRSGHTAVWTGSKMIVWGGCSHGYNNRCTALNSGGVYDPATNTWTPTSTTNAPSPRSGHTAVWTGTEMIVWGPSNTGGRYNLASNSWTPTNTLNAPSARTGFTAVWTGTEMIIWGGYEGNFVTLNTGGRYNPQTDSWTPTSTTNAPAPRFSHTAVWTGAEMIVYGGDLRAVTSDNNTTNTGGRYNPQTDSWTATSTVNAPPKAGHVVVWTGTEMIVWSTSNLKAGGRYNPQTDSWTPTDNNDSPNSLEVGVWTGAEMIVWSRNPGCISGCDSAGARYHPATYSWRPMNLTNAPPPGVTGRVNTAVWTGTEMIVWGANDGQYTTPGEGGRYNPQTDSWARTTTVNAPVNRSFHMAVWTGTEMIVWGGESNEGVKQNTGGRYNPANDSWRPTSTVNAPTPRYILSGVWTGAEMFVWGGIDTSGFNVNTGGLYNPQTDSWRATSTANAPLGRRFHTTVWTGTEAIVWGGTNADYGNGNGLLNTGGRYNPSTDSWTATSLTGAPTPRNLHTAVWTGSQMIVWGGAAQTALYVRGVHTGARYNPQADVWTPVSTHRAPSARSGHLAFWTGTGMLVWGGYAEEGAASHGGYYSAPGASDGNTPPTVRISAPADSATFESGANINITTDTADTDGTVVSVHFYTGDTLIGSDSTAPFGYNWPEVRGGSYTLKAVATDDRGGVTVSAPVRITVNPSTAPPSCVLNTPANGANYTAPASIAFSATASANRDRTMATVQFFDGTRSLGTFTSGGPTYQFNYSGLQNGTYTFTVRCTDSAGVVVTTPQTVVTVGGSTQTSVRITGQITDGRGGGISNLRVRLDASQGQSPLFLNTNLNGVFQFSGLPSGADYTVTPESTLHTFNPPSMYFQALAQNFDNANFVAQNISYSISGRLTDASGNPIYPATVNLSGSKVASAGTDFNGNYHFFNLEGGGTYTLQPYKNQYNFTPPTRTFTNLSAQQTADFVGTVVTYTIGGRITANGAGLSGVSVALGGTATATVTTDANGQYSFAGLVQGNYTVTPARSGYNFTPGSRSYSNLSGNQTSDFSATAISTSVTMQAEDFDDAWEGMAYHDTTEDNLGGQYRASGVDITNCPNASCSYMIGWNKTGEWLHYTVSIPETAAYTLALRVANTAPGGALRVEVDGADVTGALAVPNTGDSFAWTLVRKTGLNLTAGLHSVKVYMDTESAQGWVGNFDSLNFTKETPVKETTGRVNFALAANGGVAAASTQYNGSFPAAAAINGDRHRLFLPDGRHNIWHSASGAAKPDVLQVEFAGARAVDEIVVVTQQDDYAAAIDPTESMTFTKYGLTDFDIEYWNGTAWVGVPGGSVTGNDRVLRRVSFPAVTTSKIRLLARAATDGFSRVWELEAWGAATTADPPGGVRVNVAAESNGASAVVSSQYNGSFPASAAINGDRHRLFLPDGRHNIWHSAGGAAKPDWLQVNFSGAKTITEINVVTMQDDYHNAVDPTEATTFSAYGLTHFQVQYWDGANWATVPGGSVTGNDRVWRRFTFPALTTDKIRVLVQATADGFTRITEVEAYQ